MWLLPPSARTWSCSPYRRHCACRACEVAGASDAPGPWRRPIRFRQGLPTTTVLPCAATAHRQSITRGQSGRNDAFAQRNHVACRVHLHGGMQGVPCVSNRSRARNPLGTTLSAGPGRTSRHPCGFVCCRGPCRPAGSSGRSRPADGA